MAVAFRKDKASVFLVLWFIWEVWYLKSAVLILLCTWETVNTWFCSELVNAKVSATLNYWTLLSFSSSAFMKKILLLKILLLQEIQQLLLIICLILMISLFIEKTTVELRSLILKLAADKLQIRNALVKAAYMLCMILLYHSCIISSHDIVELWEWSNVSWLQWAKLCLLLVFDKRSMLYSVRLIR